MRGTPGTTASVKATPHRSPADGTGSVGPRSLELRRILGLTVPITVVLAERLMPVEQLLQVTAGTIIEFNVPFDSELVLQVADRPIGRGQAVKVGENFGLRLTRIGPVRDRIDAMGGR